MERETRRIIATRVSLLIVGGGIGGLATAIAASTGGRPVHVLEKAPEFGEIGAGLQLAPNATRMLDRLGILTDVLRHATFPDFLVMRDAASGQHITSVDLGDEFRAHFEYPYIVVHRGDLLNVELAACRARPSVTLEAGRDVIGLEDVGDVIRVECADGSRYECDAVVAADGLWSTVRKIVAADGDPVCSGYVAYRGTVPIGETPPDTDRRNMTIFVGPDLHFVQYVVHGGTLLNQVAVFKSRRYRRGIEFQNDWGTADELDEHFAGACSRVAWGIGRMRRDRRWPMFDRPPAATWTHGRVTLVGDAAHPMLQYLAQGAGQVLEDAVCLGRQLEQYPLPAAFLAYERCRLERTARAQTTARIFGDIMHIHGVGAGLRDALLAKRAANEFEYLEWIYGYTGCQP